MLKYKVHKVTVCKGRGGYPIWVDIVTKDRLTCKKISNRLDHFLYLIKYRKL